MWPVWQRDRPSPLGSRQELQALGHVTHRQDLEVSARRDTARAGAFPEGAAMSNDGEKCATCGEPLDDHSMDELIYCWRYAHPQP